MLQVWAYCCATPHHMGWYSPSDVLSNVMYSDIAMVAAVATLGVLLRARWGAIAATASAIGFAIGFGRMATQFPLEDIGFFVLWYLKALALLGSGVVVAAASAWIAWRGARSTLGTLRGIA
jgi:hypothetical protein